MLVAPRGSLTVGAVDWAIGQLRREHANVQGLARQLGVDWKTPWRSIKPRLVELAEEFRAGVQVAAVGRAG